jgi:RNA polymerase sigma-32 factor
MNTSKNLQTIEMTLPLGSLDTFIYRANQIPMLTAEEEHDCATRLQNDNDLEAARRLVMAHLRYVVRVARGYLGYGLPLGDLIQEGNIGLMKAVKRFDPTVGVRLVSFAVHWIKAEIHEYILKNWRIVKVATTKAQRKLFFNLRGMKKRLGWSTREEINAVAQDLGVTPAEVELMEQRLSAMDETYDMPVSDDPDKAYLSPAAYLEDRASDPALLIEAQDTTNQGSEQLMAALSSLDARSLDILKQRWLAEKKSTLHDLAAQYGVSAERIRQLEQTAMKKLRTAIEAAS